MSYLFQRPVWIGKAYQSTDKRLAFTFLWYHTLNNYVWSYAMRSLTWLKCHTVVWLTIYDIAIVSKAKSNHWFAIYKNLITIDRVHHADNIAHKNCARAFTGDAQYLIIIVLLTAARSARQVSTENWKKMLKSAIGKFEEFYGKSLSLTTRILRTIGREKKNEWLKKNSEKMY